MSITADVKERGILFSGRLVRAILEGRKTQTRRVLRSTGTASPVEKPWKEFEPGVFGSVATDGTSAIVTSPYGKPGDRLWVRETWRCFGGREYEYQREQKSIIYRATKDLIDSGPWRPSIFMPRWASRIDLEITRIRVERLQEITERDVRAEGCELREFSLFGADAAERDRRAGWAFAALWDGINAPRGFSWLANPWVWVIDFRRVR